MRIQIINCNMKRKIYLLFFLLLLAGIYLIYLYFSLTSFTQERIPIVLIVGTYTGLNATTSYINFGTLMPGSLAEHIIMLRSAEKSMSSLSVENIPFITAQPSVVLLQPETPSTVRLIANISYQQPLGLYSGTLVIRTQSI